MNEYSTTSFEKGLEQLGISLEEHQIRQFLEYYEILVEWNKVMNLTGITEYEEVIAKHFLDSLALVKVCDLSGHKQVIDIGTGAGFPGIPPWRKSAGPLMPWPASLWFPGYCIKNAG